MAGQFSKKSSQRPRGSTLQNGQRGMVRRSTQKVISKADAMEQVLSLVATGSTVEQAAKATGRTAAAVKNWMREPEFQAAMRDVRAAREKKVQNAHGVKLPDFPEFSDRYLKNPLFPHQLNAWDVISGRTPRYWHPSMQYEKGSSGHTIINFPPNHCPVVGTAVPTTRGLIPVEELREGDYVFDRFGKPNAVIESETIESDAEQYRVTFNTGDSFDVDASHLWLLHDLRRSNGNHLPAVEYRTDQLVEMGLLTPSGQRRWRTDNALAALHDEKDLPLDPYLFGYWLGDGDTSGSRFAASEEDCDHLVAQIEAAGFTTLVRPQRGGFVVYAHKMRKLLPLGNKHIPAEYMTGSCEQRLALLQGLMDSDGTISAKDSRARFVQSADLRQALADQVYELVASLGLQPRMKSYAATTRLPQGGTAQANTVEVSFRTGDEPIFRLPRKAAKQKPPTGGKHSARRTIASIEALAERKPVQSIVVENPDSSMLIGAGHVVAHNSKSTTWSMDFLTYLIHLDPGITIAVVSKTQNFAKKLLAGIKARLTSSVYREMHIAFAPEGGWRDPDASWTTSMIYVQGKYVGETEKDPTVEAIGMKGQIYGGRFRVIVLDDVVDKTNAHQWEDQADWVMTELDSRLPPDGGLILCLGTRLASIDLYSTLREKRDEQDRPSFTYFAQPAVLDYGEGASDTWDTLWPWQTIDASKVLAQVDGDAEARTRWPWEGSAEKEADARKVCINCYTEHEADTERDFCTCDLPNVRWCVPRWTGKNLAARRFPLGERRWGLVWQQLQVPDNATFNQKTLMTSINRMRTPGVPLAGNHIGHRRNGMDGLYVVGGLDPATVGYTAIIVSALDRDTGKRWVLDGVNIAGMRPQDMRDTIERLTKRYGINEWVIERNAFQKFLTDDPALKRILQAAGCKLTPHFTGSEKVDPDFGIMSLAPLFESTGEPPSNGAESLNWKRVKEGDLIELPDDRQAAWVSTLISQLTAWEPSGMTTTQKTDLVMALWFCDLAFKRILDRGRRVSSHQANPFITTMRKHDRKVINIQEARNALMDARAAAAG